MRFSEPTGSTTALLTTQTLPVDKAKEKSQIASAATLEAPRHDDVLVKTARVPRPGTRRGCVASLAPRPPCPLDSGLLKTRWRSGYGAGEKVSCAALTLATDYKQHLP
jgi:hypothetical protein